MSLHKALYYEDDVCYYEHEMFLGKLILLNGEQVPSDRVTEVNTGEKGWCFWRSAEKDADGYCTIIKRKGVVTMETIK
jgi:hypothetical protein